MKNSGGDCQYLLLLYLRRAAQSYRCELAIGGGVGACLYVSEKGRGRTTE